MTDFVKLMPFAEQLGVRAGTVTATARPLHVGRSTIAVSTELHDGAGRLVAQTTQTRAVLGG
jgi:1,4-dihydroxy-2-naphthoyl-CoA hydrolase